MIDISFQLVPNMESTSDADSLLVIRLSVGQDMVWDMLPYPSAQRSVVTRGTFADARSRLGASNVVDRSLTVRDLLIAGQAVPDLRITPSLAPSRLKVDGFLGLDFFSNFDLVEWRPKTSWMRLTAN